MVFVTQEHEAQVIEQVRQLVLDDKKLRCPTTNEFLLRFIKASKYNVKNSCQLVKDYYRAKKEQPNEFVAHLASSYEDILSRMDLGFLLPEEDSLGRTAVFLRFGNIDPNQEDWDRCLQALNLVLEWLSLKPNVQDYGLCIVVDCNNLTYRIMKWATPHKLNTIVKILQECAPLRFEVIHIVDAPMVFNLFFAALKPFLRGKFDDKFKFHKSPYINLFNSISPENLPQTIGGSLDVESIKDWYKDLIKDEPILKEDLSLGYK